MTRPPAPPFGVEQVRQYYDRHTPAFVRFGQGAGAGAIHRAVWAPGVRTRDQAFHLVEDRIAGFMAEAAGKAATSHVVDLGCGVGGSACYLASRLEARITGVTLSPVQARLARQRIEAAGLAGRVTCIEADYANLPPEVAAADLAYAIESFVHAPDAERFLSQCKTIVRPGGMLVLCDDFARPTTDDGAERAVGRFRRGWHVNALLQADALQAMARDAGFAHVSTEDLSPYLELRRLRDRVIRAVLPLAERLPIDPGRFDHVSGGSALQECLERGWVGYDLVRFERTRD